MNKNSKNNVRDSKLGKSFSDIASSLVSSKRSNIILSVAVFILTMKVAFQEPIVIVTPSTITEDITMHGSSISDSYKKLWAHMIADNIGNITPNNVEFKKDTLGKLLSPRIRLEKLDSMQKHAAKLKLSQSRETYDIENVYHSERQDITYVFGSKTFKIKGRDPEPMTWTFEMRIRSKNGSPEITYIKQYPGTPKYANSKSYTVEEQGIYPAKVKAAMDRNLTEKENKTLAGEFIVVGDKDAATPIERGNKSETKSTESNGKNDEN